MTTQNPFHLLLISKVAYAKRELESAEENLRAYEAFSTPSGESFVETGTPAPVQAAPVQAAPAPEFTTPPPAPAPEFTPKVQAAPPAAKKTPPLPSAYGVKKDGSPKKKPGPQKGFNRKEESAAAAGPARTSQKETPAPTAAAAPTATEAPVEASQTIERSRPGPKPGAKKGSIPSLINAISIVLGEFAQPVNNEAVIKALRERGWLPNSKKPEGYVAYCLSKNKDKFQDPGGVRGLYFLNPTLRKKANGAPSKTKAQEPQARNVDQMLKNAGIDLNGDNPFASTSSPLASTGSFKRRSSQKSCGERLSSFGGLNRCS